MCMYPQYVPTWKKVRVGKPETKSAMFPQGYGNSKNYDKLEEKPCGKCPECRKLRSAQWSFRLTEHDKYQHNGIFLTLTYDEENVPLICGVQTLKRKEARDFIKRLRKRCKDVYKLSSQPDFQKYGSLAKELEKQYINMKGSKLSYYIIGEYGTDTDRPHYHAIIWNIPKPVIEKIPEIWGKGNIYIGNVTAKSIRYVSNYLMATVPTATTVKEPEYANMSQGLGAGYLTEKASYHRKSTEPPTVRYNNFDIPMPKYFRDKIYIDDERHLLGEKASNAWQQRVEEQEKLLKEKGIDPEDYKREKDRATWRKFRKHKKYKNYTL